jgi:hypothetical protein
VDSSLPPLGGASRGLRILSQTWSPSRDKLTLEVSGAAGGEYRLRMGDPNEMIQSVEGADFDLGQQDWEIQIPTGDSEPYPHVKVVIHFSSSQKKSMRKKH